jgi:hypothetical protein
MDQSKPVFTSPAGHFMVGQHAHTGHVYEHPTMGAFSVIKAVDPGKGGFHYMGADGKHVVYYGSTHGFIAASEGLVAAPPAVAGVDMAKFVEDHLNAANHAEAMQGIGAHFDALQDLHMASAPGTGLLQPARSPALAYSESDESESEEGEDAMPQATSGVARLGLREAMAKMPAMDTMPQSRTNGFVSLPFCGDKR